MAFFRLLTAPSLFLCAVCFSFFFFFFCCHAFFSSSSPSARSLSSVDPSASVFCCCCRCCPLFACGAIYIHTLSAAGAGLCAWLPSQAIRLIEGGESELDAGDKGGQTPIHIACYRVSQNVIQTVLFLGVIALEYIWTFQGSASASFLLIVYGGTGVCRPNPTPDPKPKPNPYPVPNL